MQFDEVRRARSSA